MTKENTTQAGAEPAPAEDAAEGERRPVLRPWGGPKPCLGLRESLARHDEGIRRTLRRVRGEPGLYSSVPVVVRGAAGQVPDSGADE